MIFSKVVRENQDRQWNYSMKKKVNIKKSISTGMHLFSRALPLIGLYLTVFSKSIKGEK